MNSAKSDTSFHVAFSADFVDDDGKLIFPDIGLSLLEGIPNLSYDFVRQYLPEYVPDQIQRCDVLISLKPRVTAGSLEGVERLAAIGRCGVGYDNVDLNACTERDIAVFITPAGVIRPVGESIVLFVLAMSHNLVQKDRMVRNGLWSSSARALGKEPRERIVGTIGLGHIASDAIALLRQFNVKKFLAFDPYVTPEKAAAIGVELLPMDDVLRLSDYILINCPLTPETRHLIGEREFSLMKPEAVFINTARGAIVDQSALVAALQAKAIRGAALDVFEKEPLEPDSPLIALDNVILTPHSVAWTEELFRDMGRIDCEGALAIRQGKVPSDVVNRDVLTRPGFQRKLDCYRSMHMAGLA